MLFEPLDRIFSRQFLQHNSVVLNDVSLRCCSECAMLFTDVQQPSPTARSDFFIVPKEDVLLLVKIAPRVPVPAQHQPIQIKSLEALRTIRNKSDGD